MREGVRVLYLIVLRSIYGFYIKHRGGDIIEYFASNVFHDAFGIRVPFPNIRIGRHFCRVGRCLFANLHAKFSKMAHVDVVGNLSCRQKLIATADHFTDTRQHFAFVGKHAVQCNKEMV